LPISEGGRGWRLSGHAPHILNAPPSALAGHDAALEDLFGIDTVRGLGSNKYFALAGVLVALEDKTG
jgi:hypothetical protein